MKLFGHKAASFLFQRSPKSNAFPLWLIHSMEWESRQCLC